MPRPRLRRAFRVATLLGGLVLLAFLAAVFWPSSPRIRSSFEIIAHRGVHQPVRADIASHKTSIAFDACTAGLREPTSHAFIENTLPSIAAAFEHGATTVEIDLHVSADGHVVVFHDFYLDCHTDARLHGCKSTRHRGHQRCLLGDQPLPLLKKLDLGYGYTPDGGKTFPLRGKGVGMMPTLAEVLAAFPGHQFVLDLKGGGRGIIDAVTRTLSGHADAKRIFFYGLSPSDERQALQSVPGARILLSGTRVIKRCGLWYLSTGWFGVVPSSCRGTRLAMPYDYFRRLGPLAHALLRKIHAKGSTLVVVYAETPAEANYVAAFDVDGVLTNHIETVGDSLRSRLQR